jgi:hypothetical protein
MAFATSSSSSSLATPPPPLPDCDCQRSGYVVNENGRESGGSTPATTIVARFELSDHWVGPDRGIENHPFSLEDEEEHDVCPQLRRNTNLLKGSAGRVIRKQSTTKQPTASNNNNTVVIDDRAAAAILAVAPWDATTTATATTVVMFRGCTTRMIRFPHSYKSIEDN